MTNFVITNNGDQDADGNLLPNSPDIVLTGPDGVVVTRVKPGTCFGWLVDADGPVTLSTG